MRQRGLISTTRRTTLVAVGCVEKGLCRAADAKKVAVDVEDRCSADGQCTMPDQHL